MGLVREDHQQCQWSNRRTWSGARAATPATGVNSDQERTDANLQRHQPDQAPGEGFLQGTAGIAQGRDVWSLPARLTARRDDDVDADLARRQDGKRDDSRG
jgi:hypothetical protein